MDIADRLRRIGLAADALFGKSRVRVQRRGRARRADGPGGRPFRLKAEEAGAPMNEIRKWSPNRPATRAAAREARSRLGFPEILPHGNVLHSRGHHAVPPHS